MCLMRESAPGVSEALGGGSDVSTSDFTHSGISITGVGLLANSVACHGTQIERRVQASTNSVVHASAHTSKLTTACMESNEELQSTRHHHSHEYAHIRTVYTLAWMHNWIFTQAHSP
jgi:hypothetical protein